MRIDIEKMHKELRELKGEVGQIRSLMRGIFIDEEGLLNRYALKELAKARSTSDNEYIPHEEVKKWFGKLSGARKHLKH